MSFIQENKEMYNGLTPAQIYEMLSGNSLEHDYTSLNTVQREVLAKQTDAKVPIRNIRFHSQISPLGGASLGHVWKGEIKGVPGKEKKRILAAIRDLTGAEGELSNLLETVTILWKLPFHVNLVKCLGCCVEQSFIINEYVPNGTLLTYLQTNAGRARSSYKSYVNIKSTIRRIKEQELLKFAWQIAKGMQFLSSEKIIHGNLRASNVLLTETKICKIADYGLTTISPPTKTIHRWLSPEAISNGKCTTECDVWSYGVLVWELVTLGAQPYPGVSDEELKEKVCSGYRMRRPRHCSEHLFSIMESCWHINTRQRSNFTELQEKIDGILEGSSDYLSLNSIDEEDIYTDIPDLEEEEGEE